MVSICHCSSRPARLRQFVQSISYESHSALARQIRGEMAGEGISEIPITEESLGLCRKVVSDISIGSPNFGPKFGPAIDNRDDIFEVVAGAVVVTSSTVEGLQLGCQEVRCRHDTNVVTANPDCLCGADRGAIPSVAESKDALVGRHDVQNEILVTPSTRWGAFTGIFMQAQFAKAI